MACPPPASPLYPATALQLAALLFFAVFLGGLAAWGAVVARRRVMDYREYRLAIILDDLRRRRTLYGKGR